MLQLSLLRPWPIVKYVESIQCLDKLQSFSNNLLLVLYTQIKKRVILYKSKSDFACSNLTVKEVRNFTMDHLEHQHPLRQLAFRRIKTQINLIWIRMKTTTTTNEPEANL